MLIGRAGLLMSTFFFAMGKLLGFAAIFIARFFQGASSAVVWTLGLALWVVRPTHRSHFHILRSFNCFGSDRAIADGGCRYSLALQFTSGGFGWGWDFVCTAEMFAQCIPAAVWNPAI
ncbi:hypothetical protein BJ742DRAFT_793787 [Cladochytrium replicatum]|nr:hypothetical protein BJ742DRAFT_793787 [Cladochytrium replicatum]